MDVTSATWRATALHAPEPSVRRGARHGVDPVGDRPDLHFLLGLSKTDGGSIAAKGPPAASALTLGAFLDQWLTDAVLLTVRPRTFASYRYVVRTHLAPALGDIPLALLSPAQVQAFLNAKSASGLAPRTVGYLRGVLRQALGYAERMDLVTRNVARLARPPRIPRRPVSPLTVEQARVFLAAISGDRLEALYLVALGCGLRQGEILGLRWPDVDLAAGTLTVRYALARIEGVLVLDEPKSATSRRVVPLPAFVREALVAHHAHQTDEVLPLRPKPPDPFAELVFTTTLGTPLDGISVTRRFQRILRGAGLPQPALPRPAARLRLASPCPGRPSSGRHRDARPLGDRAHPQHVQPRAPVPGARGGRADGRAAGPTLIPRGHHPADPKLNSTRPRSAA